MLYSSLYLAVKPRNIYNNNGKWNVQSIFIGSHASTHQSTECLKSRERKNIANEFVMLQVRRLLIMLSCHLFYFKPHTTQSPLTHEMDLRFVDDIHSFRDALLRFNLRRNRLRFCRFFRKYSVLFQFNMNYYGIGVLLYSWVEERINLVNGEVSSLPTSPLLFMRRDLMKQWVVGSRNLPLTIKLILFLTLL